MRASEFVKDFKGIDLSLEIQKDDEYVDDDDTENQVVVVRASSNGRELGHVLFLMSYDGQGLILNPQDLEVDERYRGQGIAQTMYDFVKSKGYRIRRSGQQTDAGAAFWQKHRPGQNIWEQVESKQATAQQVLDYINQTHHEPFEPGGKMTNAVLAHPHWELVQVPLLNLNIPDEEYDDVEYDEYESDPYGRVMTIEPGHAGEISQQLVDRYPIVIDADRYIIDGNHRAWAAKYLLKRDYIQAWRPVNKNTP